MVGFVFGLFCLIFGLMCYSDAQATELARKRCIEFGFKPNTSQLDNCVRDFLKAAGSGIPTNPEKTLKPISPSSAPLKPNPQRLPNTPGLSATEQDNKAWEEARTGGRLADFEDYLARYPGGAHSRSAQANVVRRTIAALQDQPTESQVQLRPSEPQPAAVKVDDLTLQVSADEARDYEFALSLYRNNDFLQATKTFKEYLAAYPKSSYLPEVFFFLGNAQYVSHDDVGAVASFQALIKTSPTHILVPAASLTLAALQIGLKDTAAARKTLEDLIKTHPLSDAVPAARDRLRRLNAENFRPSASYAGRLRAKLKPNIVLFEATRAQISGNPVAEVEVTAAFDGSITARKLIKSSGVKAWDDAVLRAIDKMESLPRDIDGRAPPLLVIVSSLRD